MVPCLINKYFRIHCLNLLEEQQKVLNNLTKYNSTSAQNTTYFKELNNTLDILNNLFNKSNCLENVCIQLQAKLPSENGDDLKKSTYKSGYEILKTRANLG